MECLTVNLAERSYPISIGSGLLNQPDMFVPFISGKRVMVISNETVAPLYLAQIRKVLTNYQVDELIIPDGESHKTLASFELIMSALLKGKHGRDTTLIALGGGVIGDLVGFAASCYQRGVPFIQVPTTLLSQVDSSVGGKTAVNHPLGKNMIGAFYQPKAVIIDIDCLNSLPAKEFAAGMAEVIKYGVMWDAEFFSWLETHHDEIRNKNAKALTHIIHQCCSIKADVVSQDETETGVRALLNLGHTFGHAIEAEQGYGVWLHGEAVATGIVQAAETSLRMNLIDVNQLNRIKALLAETDLPVKGPSDMTYEQYIDHMQRDKKAKAGLVRLVLPIGIGKAELFSDVDASILQDVIRVTR